MKVYSLLEFIDYEGYNLLGVYGSLNDLLEAVEVLEGHYDGFVYTVSELGAPIDVLADGIPLE